MTKAKQKDYNMVEEHAKYLIGIVKKHPGRYNEWELVGKVRGHLAREGEDIGVKLAALVFEKAIKTGEVVPKGAGNICVSRSNHYYPSRDPHSERQDLLRRREERRQSIETY